MAEFFQPGNCASRVEAMRRIARKVAVAQRKLVEAAQWCEHHGELRIEAVQLEAMGRVAKQISKAIHTHADNARTPGSPKTRNP